MIIPISMIYLFALSLFLAVRFIHDSWPLERAAVNHSGNTRWLEGNSDKYVSLMS